MTRPQDNRAPRVRSAILFQISWTWSIPPRTPGGENGVHPDTFCDVQNTAKGLTAIFHNCPHTGSIRKNSKINNPTKVGLLVLSRNPGMAGLDVAG